jgi:hypothetical protein
MINSGPDAMPFSQPGAPSVAAVDAALETTQCACGGSGVILVEGPCDAAPLEAPCPCLEITRSPAS